MTYTPRPRDTSGVKLTPAIVALTELLAANTHENWAARRMAQGWRYGPQRDDAHKQHPCLVAYDQLPESEKEYDRQTALETLKALMGMGYHIHAPAAGPSRSDDAGAASALVLSIEGPDVTLADLEGLWRERDDPGWAHGPEAYRALGRRLLQMGAPWHAQEVVTEGLARFPDDIRLRQLSGLALARSGLSDRARSVLESLESEGHVDEETLGILGRTRKDLGLSTKDPHRRRQHLRMAYQTYAKAFHDYNSTWTGINAATLALLLGERDHARRLAGAVGARARKELETLERSGGEVYWTLATLGEASLVLEELEEAESCYSRAGTVGRGRLGDLNSTRHHARLILEHLGGDLTLIDRALRIPRVVVFAGHMIDLPGRLQPRFPPRIEAGVARAVRERLEALDGRVGFASAACGGDILFLEAVEDLGGRASSSG